MGYHEIMGTRQRYRLLDLERLCWRLHTTDLKGLRKNLEASLQAAMAKEALKREAHWTESLAVGSRGYVERIQPLILSRRDTDLIQESCGWVLKEDGVPYHAKRAWEIASKALPRHGILPRCWKIKCLLRRHRNSVCSEHNC